MNLVGSTGAWPPTPGHDHFISTSISTGLSPTTFVLMAKKGAKNSKRTTKSAPSSITDGPTLGISKLKSQLRQAKRLLLKDGLSPELRSTTEQRISQLEASITHVPSKEQERRNAIKYRRIKFFGNSWPLCISHNPSLKLSTHRASDSVGFRSSPTKIARRLLGG